MLQTGFTLQYSTALVEGVKYDVYSHNYIVGIFLINHILQFLVSELSHRHDPHILYDETVNRGREEGRGREIEGGSWVR